MPSPLTPTSLAPFWPWVPTSKAKVRVFATLAFFYSYSRSFQRVWTTSFSPPRIGPCTTSPGPPLALPKHLPPLEVPHGPTSVRRVISLPKSSPLCCSANPERICGRKHPSPRFSAPSPPSLTRS
jgi:hypothetical protein